MGQKVNPRALRLKGVQEFFNNWFSIENYADFLKEDVAIRSFIETNLKRSFISIYLTNISIAITLHYSINHFLKINTNKN